MFINCTCLTQVFSDLLLVTRNENLELDFTMLVKFIALICNVDIKLYFNEIKIHANNTMTTYECLK